MPSERNPAAADEPDDIVEKAPSHPVTTTLLVVSTVALLLAIGLTTNELSRYVNKTTRDQLQNYKITAVEYYKSLPESGEAGAEGEAPATPAPGRRKRAAKAAEEAPAEKEAPAPPPPAEEKAPAAPADGDKPAGDGQ
jgi:hypothetical protein